MTDLSRAIEAVHATDPGMVRSHNEDSVMARADLGLAVLADGMGGYNAGEVASGIAVALIENEMKQRLAAEQPEKFDSSGGETKGVTMLRESVSKANTSIFETASSQPQYAGMGTTVVVALFYNNRLTVAHIGDSRLYRLRGDDFEQITRDHSLLQEQIDGGMISKEAAKLSQNKNLVTRALGIEPKVDTEINSYDVQPEDMYLICSDGLSDMVDEEEMHLTLGTLRSNIQLAAEQLVQMANDNGGRDNISVILLRVKADFSARGHWFAKMFSWFRRAPN